MEKIIELLEEIQPGIDYRTCTSLIDEHRLDSLSIISLVADLEDEFDITIPAVEVIAENFNSAQRLWAMVTRIKEEE